MAKQNELEQLAEAIRDLEARHRSVRAGFELTEREISTFELLESTLLENIAVLKHKDVITVAHEYRKALEDLGKTRHRLVFLRINRETYAKAKSDQENLIKELKAKYVQDFVKLKNNVIRVDFRRK